MSARGARTRGGFTLSELLVSIAVLGLLTMAVSVGISGAMRVYRESVALSEAQILASTLKQAISDELRFAWEIDAGAVTYTSRTYGKKVSLTADDKGHIVVGGKGLLGEGAYTGFTAAVAVTYDKNLRCFNVTLTLKRGESDIRQETFSVRALNPPRIE